MADEHEGAPVKPFVEWGNPLSRRILAQGDQQETKASCHKIIHHPYVIPSEAAKSAQEWKVAHGPPGLKGEEPNNEKEKGNKTPRCRQTLPELHAAGTPRKA